VQRVVGGREAGEGPLDPWMRGDSLDSWSGIHEPGEGPLETTPGSALGVGGRQGGAEFRMREEASRGRRNRNTCFLGPGALALIIHHPQCNVRTVQSIHTSHIGIGTALARRACTWLVGMGRDGPRCCCGPLPSQSTAGSQGPHVVVVCPRARRGAHDKVCVVCCV
jgi:hypothetical protein